MKIEKRENDEEEEAGTVNVVASYRSHANAHISEGYIYRTTN